MTDDIEVIFKQSNEGGGNGKQGVTWVETARIGGLYTIGSNGRGFSLCLIAILQKESPVESLSDIFLPFDYLPVIAASLSWNRICPIRVLWKCWNTRQLAAHASFRTTILRICLLDKI